MEFKNLLTSPLAAAEKTEVVVSEVTLLPDACVVPLKTIHSVRTSDEGVTVLVFRVHEKGFEERYLVE